MAKDCHQLMKSLKRGLALAVFTLAPLTGVDSMSAAGAEANVIHQQAAVMGDGAIEHNGYLYRDDSCEPTFQGGNCENCCLDLWQNYCAERKNCHCNALTGRCGLGCMALRCRLALHGRILGGHGCGAHGCGSCSSNGGCHTCSSGAHSESHGQAPVPANNGSSVYRQSQPTVAPLVNGNKARRSGKNAANVNTNTVPTAPTPPNNHLPPTPNSFETDTAPASQGDDAFDTSPASTPPVPPEVDLSVEPPSPRRVSAATVSSKNNVGTARLLRQLQGTP